MLQLLNTLYRDEAGFIVSAELILVATIVVLSLVVGLAEVATGINQELEDVGSSFGSVNQSYSVKGCGSKKGCKSGSKYHDCPDQGDGDNDITCNAAPQSEGGK